MTNSQEGAEPGSPTPEPAADLAQPQVSTGEAGDPARPWTPPGPIPRIAGQPYPGQPYPSQPPYPYYEGYPVMRRGTNGFAIAALVCGIVFNVLGIVFGFVALNQIKRTGEEGRGLAIAGIWIGVASVALTVVWFVFFFITFRHFMQYPQPIQ